MKEVDVNKYDMEKKKIVWRKGRKRKGGKALNIQRDGKVEGGYVTTLARILRHFSPPLQLVFKTAEKIIQVAMSVFTVHGVESW